MLQIHQNFNWLFQIIKLTIHLSAIICLIYIIYLVYFYIWKINSDIEKVKGQNLVIKKWTVFISVCFFLILLIRILFINKSCAIIGADSYLITGIWLTAFVIIIIKQEILYGFDYLRIVIETVENNQKENIEEVAFKKIWEIESQVKDVETEKDLSLKNIVSPNLKEYIIKIEAISFGTDFFIKNSVSMEDLASELNLPASHIAYVFKFHSKVSFSEYKKIIRIQHAIKQLDTNYIKNNTLEALAFEVGFTSYTSFYTAFKNITGKSPQEYLR
jgi:AraC-like DNA-binding protein